MPARLYGQVQNVPIGATFPDRLALAKAGVHRATQAGITGGGDGTESIVLNAGYADDVDHGDEVIYTGHGGRNANTGPDTPARVPTTTLRIVRDTALSATIKAAHDYRCQICDIQLAVPTGFYAESAHVQPLGSPHNGPDISGNVLCLCPNHHVLFDKGTIWIDSAMIVQPLGTPIKRPEVHPVDAKYAAYHAGHFRAQ